ncbi:hypothetical protein [Actinokineospora diospyrosa]|uniref:Uncharacterized protein n=1 Tax=Actinokineospora diospyrosa TaxID=103728 RepID=A0ABT1I984_9PSEU|nr:hypothetical protein [Actinokineospora diospyrosa]MCP2269204.1 hypothetical protein [Actinokineospora diospyrosa]
MHGIAVPGALTVERAGRIRDLIAAVVCRLLDSPSAWDHLDRVAEMLLWSLGRFSNTPLPGSLTCVNAVDGTEPDHIRDLRRALAESLLRLAHTRFQTNLSLWAHKIKSGWGRRSHSLGRDIPSGLAYRSRPSLLYSDDADWAADLAAKHKNHSPALADAFHELAQRLSTPPPEAPVGPTVDPTQIEKFVAVQRDLFDRAFAGEVSVFAQLVANMQFDPDTLRGELWSSWRVAEMPAARIWSGDKDWIVRFRHAATTYLREEHDHHEDWLGHGTTNRALAAMVAFTSLHDPDHAADTDHSATAWTDIPDNRWANWVGVILDQADRFNHTHHKLDGALLARAAQHAFGELADVLRTLVARQLEQGRTVRLPQLPSSVMPILADLARTTADQLLAATSDTPDDQPPQWNTALASWQNLVQQPLQAHDPATLALATRLVAERSGPAEGPSQQLAVTAATSMLAANPAAHWPDLHPLLAADPDFASRFALHSADYLRRGALLTELNETQLIDAYHWLTNSSNSEIDLISAGAHAVTPEEEVHFFRSDILSALAKRGTADAVHRLAELARANPTMLALQAQLHQARRNAQAAITTHLPPDQVSQLLADPRRRVINTAAQAVPVILEALQAVQDDLPSHSNLLWDRDGTKPETDQDSTKIDTWRPKSEGALSAYLAHELRLRLAHTPVVINREVVILPTDAGDSGERPDIKVDFVPHKGSTGGIISIPLEIKGAWHEKTLTSQATQLAPYCATLGTDHGIYLVGWFPIAQWTSPIPSEKVRRNDASKHTSAKALLDTLVEQAASILLETRTSTHPLVLTIRRQAPRRTDE